MKYTIKSKTKTWLDVSVALLAPFNVASSWGGVSERADYAKLSDAVGGDYFAVGFIQRFPVLLLADVPASYTIVEAHSERTGRSVLIWKWLGAEAGFEIPAEVLIDNVDNPLQTDHFYSVGDMYCLSDLGSEKPLTTDSAITITLPKGELQVSYYEVSFGPDANFGLFALDLSKEEV